jgi:hypothetical protein
VHLPGLYRLEQQANHLRLPTAYASMRYMLRHHIALVRERLMAQHDNPRLQLFTCRETNPGTTSAASTSRPCAARAGAAATGKPSGTGPDLRAVVGGHSRRACSALLICAATTRRRRLEAEVRVRCPPDQPRAPESAGRGKRDNG